MVAYLSSITQFLAFTLTEILSLYSKELKIIDFSEDKTGPYLPHKMYVLYIALTWFGLICSLDHKQVRFNKCG